MVKIAILGVEGSGKTVLFSVMGARYETPDANGLFLAPLNHETYSYCRKGMAALRKGQWPLATSPDTSVQLSWQLMETRRFGRNARPLAQLSFLDFAGEAYRKAFGANGSDDAYDTTLLKSYVKKSDILIVLVDLGKIINGAEEDERTIEMNWLSQSMLSFASSQRRRREMALVFTQTDRYLEIVKTCGGTRGTLARYLPIVSSTYGGKLPLFAVSAVDTTAPCPDDPTIMMPSPDFGSMGFDDLMKWMRKAAIRCERRRACLKAVVFLMIFIAFIIFILANGK